MTDYSRWTDDDLISQSDWLYQEYLRGEDVLDALHAIAEELRKRNGGLI